jgi:hypothetical protein
MGDSISEGWRVASDEERRRSSNLEARAACAEHNVTACNVCTARDELTGRADNADLREWMARKYAAAWNAYEAEEERHWSVLCAASADQKRAAKQHCLSAALVAWEEFDGYAPPGTGKDHHG